MLRGYGLLITSAALLALLPLMPLLLGGCTGEEFLVGGGNDGAGGGPTTTGTGVTSSTGTGATGSTSSSTSTGSGGCAGCLQDGACQAGTAVDACGAAGAACQACSTDQLCQTASCNAQACGTTPANDGDPCPFVAGDETSGQCVAGACLESPENCLNGLDDDEDGDADCLDADCNASFVCAADTPEGWDGPVAVYEGAVECPGVWGVPHEGDFGRDATAASYTCACTGTVSGCEEVSFDFNSTALGKESCTGGPVVTPTTVAANGCVSLGTSTESHFATDGELTEPIDCVGTVNPGVEIPPASFGEVFTICDAPVPEGGAGCDAGACRPRVPDSGGAQGAICITRAGDNTCPAPFTSKRVIGAGFDDTRGCDCTCTEPSCAAEIGFYDEPTCTECEVEPCAGLGLTEPCANDLPAGALYAGWVPEPTSVTADAEVGELDAADELTVCCLP